MKISIQTRNILSSPLVIFVCENENNLCGIFQIKNVLVQAKLEGFKGKENSVSVTHPANAEPSRQVVLVGIGDRKKISSEVLRRASAQAVKKIRSLSLKSATLVLPHVLENVQQEAYVLSEGALLANYEYLKYKSQKQSTQIESLELVTLPKNISASKKGAEQAKVLADSVCFVRNLVNEPPSDLNPSVVARHAVEIARQGKSAGISIKIFDKKKIEQMKMGALLGVSRGSAQPPVFIHLHYQPKNARKKIALVGKGVTFDSGGLSLKPAQSMETMKMDMAGAASILGVFKALPFFKPSVEVHGILAVTENMPGGKAYKPGDVLTAMNGKTIEVLNTDAEGRLILADALTYASRLKPDQMINLATLTGACLIALGSLVCGAMGNDEHVFKQVDRASKETGEQFWPLPLVKDYQDGLKSSIADLQNISSVRGEAGTIVGGLFLQEFVEDTPWLHLDIAGPAWSNKDFCYYSKGGTGFPTRTLLHYLLQI